jgi:hypothetical protein
VTEDDPFDDRTPASDAQVQDIRLRFGAGGSLIQPLPGYLLEPTTGRVFALDGPDGEPIELPTEGTPPTGPRRGRAWSPAELRWLGRVQLERGRVYPPDHPKVLRPSPFGPEPTFGINAKPIGGIYFWH